LHGIDLGPEAADSGDPGRTRVTRGRKIARLQTTEGIHGQRRPCCQCSESFPTEGFRTEMGPRRQDRADKDLIGADSLGARNLVGVMAGAAEQSPGRDRP
jgi:hypothetical protein